MTNNSIEQLILTQDIQINHDGLYAISISAICYHGQQLRVVIDDQIFREIPESDNIQKYNNAASWNGNKLNGSSQTNVYITNFNEGIHKIAFFAKDAGKIADQDTLNRQSIKYQVVDLGKEFKKDDYHEPIKFNLNMTAEKRNRQPWINFIFISLPVQSCNITATTNWREKWDGDDIKLIIDGRIRQNSEHFATYNWLWRSISGQKETTITQNVITNLTNGIHYIEFWADQCPTLNTVRFNLSQEISNTRDAKVQVLDESVISQYPHAKRLDCYTEHYAARGKPALIVYDPDYHQDNTNYLIYFWDSYLNKWQSVTVYDMNHDSKTQRDDGVNMGRPQPDSKQPLPDGWFAFFIGTTWLTNKQVLLDDLKHIELNPDKYTHLLTWDNDDNWVIYKI